MNRLQKSLTGVALACAVAMGGGGATAATGGWGAQPAASAACQTLNAFPPSTGAAGTTNGNPTLAFVPGDRVSISVTMGTATSSSVSIVGNSTGTPVLAGPLTGPGTLSYTVNGPLPAGSIGIGFYVNSTTPQGGTVTVAISCADAPSIVPAWGPLGAGLVTFAAAMIGALTLRRRRRA